MSHDDCMKGFVYQPSSSLLSKLSTINESNGQSSDDEVVKLVDVRRLDLRVKGVQFALLRCFIRCPTSGVFGNVGWIVNDCVDSCLICFQPFHLFRWKHHCRACGTLVCAQCCEHRAQIMTAEELGPLRVCRDCYKGQQDELIPVLNTRHLGVSLRLNHSIDNTAATTKKQQQRPAEQQVIHEDDAHLVPAPSLNIIPSPGYVVKTRRQNGNEKVFINIGHHSSVKDANLTLFNIVLPSGDDPVDQDDLSRSPTTVPIVYLPLKADQTPDRNGHTAALYWVVIASEYFQQEARKYTSSAIVQKILECVNLQFRDTLVEQEYVRPRVKGGVKGGKLTESKQFILNTQPVSLLLRVQGDSDDRSVYTMRTAPDLQRAREEDEDQFMPLPVDAITQRNTAILRLLGGGSGGDKNAAKGQQQQAANDHNMRDTESEVSDITFTSSSWARNNNNANYSIDGASNNNNSNSVRIRFSWLRPGDDKFGPSGRALLSAAMLVYRKDLSLSSNDVSLLLHEAVRQPAILMGYQIQIDLSVGADGEQSSLTGGETFIFVITGIRKNNYRKTEYRISSLLREDQWVLLRRSDNKLGLPFRPLRKVLAFPKT